MAKKSNIYIWFYIFSYSRKFCWISKLKVENSFINYFDKETEIYKGMKKIDDELGGTTPLNIILKISRKTKKY